MRYHSNHFLGYLFLFFLMIILNSFDSQFSKGSFVIKNSFRHQKLNLFITLIVLFFCLTNTKIPNWGRLNFQTKWNSVKEIEYVDNKEIYKEISPGYFISPGNAVVMLNQPLGWLKQFAPEESFNLLNAQLPYKPFVIDQIKNNIKNSTANLRNDSISKDFIVIENIFEDNSKPLIKYSSFSTINNQFNFSTKECSEFKTGFGSKIKKCNATLDE